MDSMSGKDYLRSRAMEELATGSDDVKALCLLILAVAKGEENAAG